MWIGAYILTEVDLEKSWFTQKLPTTSGRQRHYKAFDHDDLIWHQVYRNTLSTLPDWCYPTRLLLNGSNFYETVLSSAATWTLYGHECGLNILTFDSLAISSALPPVTDSGNNRYLWRVAFLLRRALNQVYTHSSVHGCRRHWQPFSPWPSIGYQHYSLGRQAFHWS